MDGTVGKVAIVRAVVDGVFNRFELDAPDTFSVDVNIGDGVNTDGALAQRARRPTVAGIAQALLSVAGIPSKVTGVGVSGTNALTMTAAVIWARLTSATSTLETGEAFAFASGSVANTLVGAFAVEMGFVPFCGVDVTSQTVVGVVLFSDGGVVVVEVDLLISVNALVSVNVTKRRVDEGVATVAKTFSTVIANETAFTFTGGTGVAHTVVVAVVVAASCNLCHQGTQCCEANGVHFVVFVF